METCVVTQSEVMLKWILTAVNQVKPVRDSVTEALLLWKAIYDPNAAQSQCQSPLIVLSVSSRWLRSVWMLLELKVYAGG